MRSSEMGNKIEEGILYVLNKSGPTINSDLIRKVAKYVNHSEEEIKDIFKYRQKKLWKREKRILREPEEKERCSSLAVWYLPKDEKKAKEKYQYLTSKSKKEEFIIESFSEKAEKKIIEQWIEELPIVIDPPYYDPAIPGIWFKEKFMEKDVRKPDEFPYCSEIFWDKIRISPGLAEILHKKSQGLILPPYRAEIKYNKWKELVPFVALGDDEQKSVLKRKELKLICPKLQIEKYLAWKETKKSKIIVAILPKWEEFKMLSAEYWKKFFELLDMIHKTVYEEMGLRIWHPFIVNSASINLSSWLIFFAYCYGKEGEYAFKVSFDNFFAAPTVIEEMDEPKPSFAYSRGNVRYVWMAKSHSIHEANIFEEYVDEKIQKLILKMKEDQFREKTEEMSNLIERIWGE